MSYPLDKASRQAHRDHVFALAVLKAVDEATVAGRTIKCAGGMRGLGEPIHAGEPGGCLSNGETCLCPCHDPQEQP